MELVYARFHKRDGEGEPSGVAKIGDASGSSSPAIVPRRVFRKELLTNEFLAKSLSCALCSDILDDPRSAGCGEGHSFCARCLSDHYGESESAKCPTCSKEIVKSKGQANVQLGTLVKDLCVNCPSKLSYNCEEGEYEAVPGGCGWKERLEDLAGHLSKCEHQTVECPGAANGCPVYIWKWGLSGHMKQCTHRCECECGQSMPVQELEKHKQMSCAKTRISCPHEKLGCEAKVLRPEIAAHLEKCDFQRLRLTFLALEGKHTADLAKLKQEFEVQLAAERAYFQQEVDRLKGQLLLAKHTDNFYQRGAQKVRFSQGGFARRAHALGLQSAEELEVLKEHGPGKKRKRAGKGAAGPAAANGGLAGAKSGLGQQTGAGTTAVPVLAEKVDLSQFVQVPEGSLFQFDALRAGDGNGPQTVNGPSQSGQVQPISVPPEQVQNEVTPTPPITLEIPISEEGQEGRATTSPPQAQEQAQAVTTSAKFSFLSTPQTTSQPTPPAAQTQSSLPMVSIVVPTIPASLPSISVSVPAIPTVAISIPPLPTVATTPPLPVATVVATETAKLPTKKQTKKAKTNPPTDPPVFKYAASSKPGFKRCPWTPSCKKRLPQNATKCPGCGKEGPKESAPAPTATKRKCAACGELNPVSFITCMHCNTYMPREYSSNKCPNCARGNNGNARNCGACGTELRPKRVASYSGNTCPKCAHGNIASARKCKTCGHEMRPASLVGRLKL